MNNGQTRPSSSSELNHPFFTDGNGINNDPSFNSDPKNSIDAEEINTKTSGPNPLTPENKPIGNPYQIPNDKNGTDEPSVGIQSTGRGGFPEKDASESEPLTNPVEVAKKLEKRVDENPTSFYHDYQNLRDSSGENNND